MADHDFESRESQTENSVAVSAYGSLEVSRPFRERRSLGRMHHRFSAKYPISALNYCATFVALLGVYGALWAPFLVQDNFPIWGTCLALLSGMLIVLAVAALMVNHVREVRELGYWSRYAGPITWDTIHHVELYQLKFSPALEPIVDLVFVLRPTGKPNLPYRAGTFQEFSRRVDSGERKEIGPLLPAINEHAELWVSADDALPDLLESYGIGCPPVPFDDDFRVLKPMS